MSNEELKKIAETEYQYGFETHIEQETLPPGLDESVIAHISRMKNEPDWLREFRLAAYRHWLTLEQPDWGHLNIKPIDYQAISYYSAPKTQKDGPKSLDKVDPELLRTYEKLGIPLQEREMLAGVAVDAVFDSVSVATSFKDRLGLAGCTAPKREEHQLHAAVVEIIAHENAEVKYSTVQNWFPGDKDGNGGIYNFVTKRGLCEGARSKISWTQVETGSAITWKYPGVVLKGDDSIGEFYSVALARDYQQIDSGSKMIHIGKNTKSTIISKGISLGHAQNAYRGLVKILPGAAGARNFSQCDSLLIGSDCGAHTFPYLMVQNPSAQVEHEATTAKIGEDQIFYCMQRGLSEEDAVSLIVNGFCKEIFQELPMEFAVEAQRLIELKLEGSVG